MLTGFACFVFCLRSVLPWTCLFLHRWLWKLMTLLARQLLCSRWCRTESPVFCCVASGGCLTYPLLVHIQGTSSCMVSVWACVRASLVLLIVVVLEGLLPFLLLVAPQHHLSCIHLCIYVVVSSKFVEPFHSWSSVACLFVVQLPVIICPVPSCSMCWSHHSCSFCCEPADIWAIVCLLWNVQVMSWLGMYSLPQMSFSDPIVCC